MQHVFNGVANRTVDLMADGRPFTSCFPDANFSTSNFQKPGLVKAFAAIDCIGS